MGTEGGNVRVIAGRYRLEAVIGRGGMGVVWRAADTLLGRQVAVKELGVDETLSEDEARQQRERMLREARAVAQLRHAHIIVVHDVVLHDGRPYIVMELVSGGSLADRLAQDGSVDAVEAARIGLALLGALRVAHAAGVLHRDLKPANVLLEPGTGRVVLTDFGIAQVEGATTLTETGGFVGSPEYTAPERMSGDRAGAGADLWSLGALLIAAVSGESPFRRDSLGGILHAVVYEEIRPPIEAEPLLPVIQGLLQREPVRRMGLDEAERLLRAYVATGSTPQYAPHRVPYSPTERDVPALRRRRVPTRVLLVASALVAALAGAGIAAAALLAGDGDNSPAGPSSAAPGSSRTASATGSPTPTVTVTRQETRTETPSPSAPQGYRIAEDAKGFSLAVPDGFTRSLDGPRVFYMSPGKVFRIGVKVTGTQAGGPGDVQRRAAADGPRNNPGYRDGKVTDTSHDGQEAALWEFSWDGFSAAEGARHTVDLCWEEDGRMYDVWVSAPVGRTGEARAYFDAAVDTFVAAPGR
ncbi:serine/threonine protein kinase [Streptomyces sp. SID14478]|uniref:serine/threonine-protein kinase n=1 Tax=Streptomyces sp. SID14478 TaxID=2706073 RepID=UPI0013DAB834|nr:serine/threonine-protein kinase [Streptomyces sp. SID14478]NEB74002.1 serine/threonine protein kinase [Streptomyces sp. SID14478]